MKKIILWGSVLLVVFILIGMNTVSNTERTTTTNTTNKPVQQVNTVGPYTNNLDVLESTVIDEDNDVKAIYVYTIIGFLTDFDPKVQEYPFYATKNRKGDGYIGVVVTDIGKAIFLIPNYKTLNETDKTKLEGLVKAVNGTAKSLNPRIEFASGYDPLEVLDWGVHSYKVGDPVIFTESGFAPVLYNNLKGRIAKITPIRNEIQFEIIIAYTPNPFDAQSRNVELLENLPDGKSKIKFSVSRLDNVDEDLDDSDRLVPFQISYATSIHKAQGLEYNSVKLVFVDEVQDMVTHSIFYTAITRSKERLEIYWSPETANKVYERIKSNLNKQDSDIFKNKFNL